MSMGAMGPEPIDPLEVKALDEYTIHQQELGLPLFPAYEAKARTELEGYRSIFTDLKKVDEWEPSMKQVAATSPDPDKARQMFANSMFLAKELGKSVAEVQANYNEWMGGYSQKVWGKRVADTAGFYGMAQGHVKKETEAEDTGSEAMRLALTSAALGTNDSVGDYQKWREKTAGKEPSKDAHLAFSFTYSKVKSQIEDKKHIVSGAVSALKQMMSGEGATAGTDTRIVDALVDMDPKDRPLVLAAIMAGAQATGEASDKDWTTLFPQIGESFSRILTSAWGGVGRQELEQNLITVKAEYLGGKDGKMLLPESPVTSPEQARDLVEKTLLEVIGKKTGLMQMGTGSSTGMGGGPVSVSPIGEEGTKRYRTPTEQERRLINSELNRVTRINQITREIENAAVATDPVKALFANSIGSTLALVPMAMMGPGGMMVAAKAYSGMEYDKVRLMYPTIPEDKVSMISDLSGFVMAGLDKIEGDFLTGKLPSVSHLIKKGIFSTVVGRMGLRAVEGVLIQNFQEFTQDASRLVIQDLAAAVDSDVEGTDLSEWSGFWDERLDVAIDMIPLNLIGLGAGTYNDFSNAVDAMKRREYLNLAGINDEAAAPIIDLANKGDEEGSQAALREAFLNRDPEVARAASERMGPAAQATQRFDTLLTQNFTPRYTQEGDNHILTFPDGRVIKAESWGEARWYMEQAMGDKLSEEITVVADMANFFTGQQREGMTERVDMIPKKRTQQQEVEAGTITEEQARERAAIAGEAFGLTPEEAQEETWTVLGRNTVDTQEEVAKSAIDLFEGAGVDTVMEEVVEGRLKVALDKKRYSMDQVKRFIAQVESVTNEKFLVADTEQGVIEAISAIVVADVIGRRKDGTQLPAGLVTRGMLQAVQRQSTPQANRKLMGMVQAFRSFFRQVFARARALNKAKAEGTLGKEYQGFVDELLGVDPQVRELNVAATEARATATAVATGETQQTPMEKQAASSLKLGAIVRYNGYVGRLEQDGQRFVVRAPDQEVELSGEDLVEVVLERDPATTRELFVKELGATEVNLVEGKFTPAPSGLAIISPTGVRLVPQNRTLSKNVVQTPDGMAFRVLDPAKGRITLLTGQQAQQAMDAMLEAAGRQEAAGRKVSYSLGRATQSAPQQVTGEFFSNPDSFYRVIVGEEALQDILDTGTVRTNATEKTKEGMTLAEKMAARPTAFPSFSKGNASMSYAGQNENHSIVVTEDASMQPSTSGRHSAGKTMFPTVNGVHQKSLNSNFAVYKHMGDGKYEKVFDSTEAAGQKVSYALAPAKFSEQVMTELEKELGKDPAQRWAMAMEIVRRISKLSTEVDAMAAADLTASQRIEAQKQFTQNRYEELLNEMPPGQTDEAKFEVMTQARKEGDEWAKQNKADAPGQRERIIGYQRIVNAALMGLPKNLRTDIGGFLQVADARSATTALKAIKNHIGKIGDTVERYLKEEFQTEIKALIKRGKPNLKAGEAPSSNIGAEASNLFGVAAEAIKMNEVQTLKAISDRETEILDPNNKPTPEREQQLRDEINIINLAGDLKNATAAESKALLDTLQEIYDGGYLIRLARENQKRAVVERLKDMFKVGTGLKTPQEVEAAMAKMRARGKVKLWWDTILLELGSFNDLIYMLAGENSEFARELLNMERKSDNMVHDLNDAMEKDVGDFFTRIAGSEIKGQHLRAAMSLNTKKGKLWLGVNKAGQPPVKHVIKIAGQPDAVEYTSQMEAIHDLMMWRQPDGKRNMGGKYDLNGERTSTWGYDDAWAQETMNQLTPEAWQLMDWLTQQYKDEYAVIDPLVRDRLGVMLPQNPLYSPLTNSPAQVQAGQMTNPVTGAAVNGSMGITSPALKTRNTSINKPRKGDALKVFMAHSRQMNHWIANYDFARTMQQLFLSREMLDYVEAKGGEAAVRMLLARVDMAVLGGMRDSGVQLAIDGALKDAAGRAAASAILGRVSTLAVQSTQLFAGSMKMPQSTFLRLFGKLSAGQLDWSGTKNSQFIQRRIAQKSPLVQEAMRGLLNATSPSLIKNQQRRLAELLAGTDAYFTAATHTMIYHHQLEVAKGLGMKGAEAEQFAMDEADRLTEEVAQPVRQSQRSLLELRNSQTWGGRVGWAFASEARQKLAILMVAADKVKTDPSWNNIGELARVANYVFMINGLLVQMWKRSWLLARTPGGDDEDFDWKGIVLSSLASPLTGAPGWQVLTDTGNMLSAGMRSEGAVKRMVATITGEDQPYDGDPVKFMKDAELILGALSLFSDTAATLSGYSHVVTDLAKLIDAQTED
jgi:hypothetical protein